MYWPWASKLQPNILFWWALPPVRFSKTNSPGMCFNDICLLHDAQLAWHLAESQLFIVCFHLCLTFFLGISILRNQLMEEKKKRKKGGAEWQKMLPQAEEFYVSEDLIHSFGMPRWKVSWTGMFVLNLHFEDRLEPECEAFVPPSATIMRYCYRRNRVAGRSIWN